MDNCQIVVSELKNILIDVDDFRSNVIGMRGVVAPYLPHKKKPMTAS